MQQKKRDPRLEISFMQLIDNNYLITLIFLETIPSAVSICR